MVFDTFISYLTKSTGGKVNGSDARYQPFGPYRTTPTQTITDTGYTGQHHNPSLGLIYYNARYYAPALARFISPDTLIPAPTNPQSFNRYAYVLNNPTNRVDPAGHASACPMSPASSIPCNDDNKNPSPPSSPNCAMSASNACDNNNDNTPSVPPSSPPSNLCDDVWCTYPDDLPIDNWNPTSANNDLRLARTLTVLDWLANYNGSNWWGGPPGSMPTLEQLIAWLLYEEMSVYANNYQLLLLAARIIYTRLKELTPTALSGFTAFFDPNGNNMFDQQDWQELVLLIDNGVEIELSLYLEIAHLVVENDLVAPAVNGESVLYWWSQSEAPNTSTASVYLSLNNDTFFFGSWTQCLQAGFCKQ